MRSISFEIFDNFFNEFEEESASLDLPPLLLGDLANAGIAVLPGAQQKFETVDIGSLVCAFLLGCLIAGLVGCIR